MSVNNWIYLGIGLILVIAFVTWMAFQRGFKQGHQQGADDFFKLLLTTAYAIKVASFKAQNRLVSKGGIAFIGDSITQDFPVHDFFSGHLVYNRGIGGDTTQGLLNRLTESVFELSPRVVVILIGTNDLALLTTTPLEIAHRIQQIVNRINEMLPQTKIILQSVYPVNSKLDSLSVGKRTNQSIQLINQHLASLTSAQFVNMDPWLKDDQGQLKKDYTVEGLHINHVGYEVITEVLKPLIQ